MTAKQGLPAQGRRMARESAFAAASSAISRFRESMLAPGPLVGVIASKHIRQGKETKRFSSMVEVGCAHLCRVGKQLPLVIIIVCADN